MDNRVPLDTVCEKKIATLPAQYYGTIEYLDISSVDNKEKRIISSQILDRVDAPSRARQLIRPGDILISTVRPNLNAVALVDRASKHLLVASTGYCVLRCHSQVDNHYVFHFCQSPYFIDDMVCQTTGANYPPVNSATVKNSLIPLPPLEEQRTIAATLDKLQHLIVLRKQQLAQLDALLKARFMELFGDPSTNPQGYPIRSLAEIAEYYNGLTYKPEDVTQEGTIVLRASNIQNSQLNFSDIVRVNCTIRDRLFVRENDILMCSRNGSARLVGKVALIQGLSEPMSFGAFMLLIRSQYSSYLMTYFQLDAFRTQIRTGATTTIHQVTSKMLDAVTLPVPGLSDIAVFATFVEQVNQSKLRIQEGLDELERVKQSLLQKYFK